MTRRSRRVEPRGARRARERRTRALIVTLVAVIIAALAVRWAMTRLHLPWRESRKRATHEVISLPTPRAYVDAAVAANSAGDFPRLLATVDSGLERFPDDPLLLLARGAALNNMSFRVERHRGRIVPGLASSLERVRAARSALEAYDAVASRFPALPEPVGERGLVLATWGLPEDGRRDLEHAYDLGDRREEVLNALRLVDQLEKPR